MATTNIIFASPGEILFKLGPFNVHWYGLIMAVAFLVGLITSIIISKKDTKTDTESDHLVNVATILIIGGVLFSRIYYVFFNWDYFSLHVDEIFMTWRGGLSIHGAIIGGFIILFIYTGMNNLPFLRFTDIFAYGAVLGQSLGRWANYFNSEAFGYPTDLPWKIYIPPENRPLGFLDYNYFHPTFLYESIWNLIVFFVLFYYIRKNYARINGVITCSYLILYSAGRYFIDGIRLDNIYSISGLHLAQFTSIVFLGVGVLGLLILYLGKKFALIKEFDGIEALNKEIAELEKLEKELAIIRKTAKATQPFSPPKKY